MAATDARFSVKDAATDAPVIGPDWPGLESCVRVFGDKFPQGSEAFAHMLERLTLLEGFVFTTPVGQRLYVRRVA